MFCVKYSKNCNTDNFEANFTLELIEQVARKLRRVAPLPITQADVPGAFGSNIIVLTVLSEEIAGFTT